MTPLPNHSPATRSQYKKIPTVNFEAGDCIDLINWNDIDLTLTPLLAQIPQSVLNS